VTYTQLTKWKTQGRPQYAVRFGLFIFLYFIAYSSILFFATGLGRPVGDDVRMVGGLMFYAACLALIGYVFQLRSLWTLMLAAVFSTMALRGIGLLPYLSETSPSALIENAVMHGLFATASTCIGFFSVNYLLRQRSF